MLATEWEDLSHAGAFLLGAALATIACLRIVRAVTTFFSGVDRHSRDGKPD